MPRQPDPNLARAAARLAFLRSKLAGTAALLDQLDVLEATAFDLDNSYDATCVLLDGCQDLAERQLGAVGLGEMIAAEGA